MFFDKIGHEDGDILLALAQRRYLYGDDVQPVVEVVAECPALNGGLKVDVGGGYHADIDLYGDVAADALEHLFLKHAQKLDLQVHGQRRDLVEEDGAAVSVLELAEFFCVRPGKRAFLVAE
ncbi:MAG: hypothetical protein HZB85_00805 [Deltaproteobacteria bacterium]|nr:hypothetical protein [Deltaproteobacteria bacterium]